MDSGGQRPYAPRAATTADHPFLVRSHHAGLRPWIERTWGWDDAAQDEFAREWLATRDEDTQVVVVDGQDAGYLVLHRGRDPWYLSTILLIPGFQGRGIGTALLTDIVREADEAGVPVRLQVMKVNPARRLYARLGFEVDGEEEHHWRMQRTPGGDTQGLSMGDT